ncbi:hypothetical protein ACLB2K_052647 [Fragaria x ananassa]
MLESAARELIFHKDCDTLWDKDVPSFSPHRSLQLSHTEAVSYVECANWTCVTKWSAHYNKNSTTFRVRAVAHPASLEALTATISLFRALKIVAKTPANIGKDSSRPGLARSAELTFKRSTSSLGHLLRSSQTSIEAFHFLPIRIGSSVVVLCSTS